MTMTSDFIRHHALLDRLARGIAKEYTDAFKTIADYIELEISSTPDFVDLAMLRVDIQRKIDIATEEIKKKLQEFAQYESRFTKRVIEKHTKEDIELPSELAVAAIGGISIATSYTKQAASLTASFDAFAQSKTNDYMRMIDDSIIQQEEKEERTSKIDDAAAGILSTQANVLVGLGVLAVASNTLKLVQAYNGIDAVQWLAILDSHVCPYCSGLHREVFNVDAAPAHPAHGNCRCSLVPYVR